MEPKQSRWTFVQRKPGLTLAIALVAVVTAGMGGYFLGAHRAPPQEAVPLPSAVPAGPQARQWQALPETAFGNWRLVCVQNTKGAKRCELVLRAVAPKSRQFLAALAIGQGPRGHAILTVRTPPAVILPKGVHLKLGDSDLGGMGFVACTPRFCEAVRELDDKTVESLRAAATAGVRYTLANGREIGFKLSAKGFATGYPAWQAAMPPADANTK